MEENVSGCFFLNTVYIRSFAAGIHVMVSELQDFNCTLNAVFEFYS